MTPEGKVKKEIKDYLRSKGAYFFMPVQTGYGSPTLDILACVNGKFVGIEVKRPGKGATARQHLIISEIIQAGGIAFVADRVEDVVAELVSLL